MAKRKPEQTPLLTGDHGVEQRKAVKPASIVWKDGEGRFLDGDGNRIRVWSNDTFFIDAVDCDLTSLSREHCAALYPLLKQFAETGKLKEPTCE